MSLSSNSAMAGLWVQTALVDVDVEFLLSHVRVMDYSWLDGVDNELREVALVSTKPHHRRNEGGLGLPGDEVEYKNYERASLSIK